MYGKYTIVFLAALIPGFVLGQTGVAYQCSFDGMQRRIVILSEPGVTVPCEVHYYKDTEMPGESQVLWRATTEAGYCESKAEEFAGKLRELGWECAPAVPTEPAAESEAVEDSELTDDTAALEPAD